MLSAGKVLVCKGVAVLDCPSTGLSSTSVDTWSVPQFFQSLFFFFGWPSLSSESESESIFCTFLFLRSGRARVDLTNGLDVLSVFFKVLDPKRGVNLFLVDTTLDVFFVLTGVTLALPGVFTLAGVLALDGVLVFLGVLALDGVLTLLGVLALVGVLALDALGKAG